MDIAYLSAGKLHVRLADGTTRAIESDYADGMRRRAAQMVRKNALRMP